MSGDGILTREAVTWISEQKQHGYTNEEIGDALGVSYKTVVRSLHKYGFSSRCRRPKLQKPAGIRLYN